MIHVTEDGIALRVETGVSQPQHRSHAHRQISEGRNKSVWFPRGDSNWHLATEGKSRWHQVTEGQSSWQQVTEERQQVEPGYR